MRGTMAQVCGLLASECEMGDCLGGIVVPGVSSGYRGYRPSRTASVSPSAGVMTAMQ